MPTVTATLAELSERLANHIRNTDIAIQEVKDDRREAAAERSEILEAIHSLTREMREIKPVIDFVDSARAKISGALILLGFLGTIVWGGVLFWKEQLLQFLHK